MREELINRIFSFAGVCFLLLAALFNRDIELAERYIVLSKYIEAKQILERLYIDAPSNARVLRGLHKVYFALKEYDKLREIINAELTYNPRSIELYIELGRLDLALTDLEGAYEAFVKAVELAENPIGAAEKAVEGYISWGYVDAGIRFLEDIGEKLDRKDELSFKLGELYVIKGDVERALKEYLMYLRVSPGNEVVVLAKLKEFGKSDSELVYLENAIKSELRRGGNEIFLYNLLYQTEVSRGKLQEAFRTLKKLEKLDDTKGSRIWQFAYSLREKGEYKLLADVADFLVANYRGEDAGLMGRFFWAVCLREKGKVEEAVEIFSEMASFIQTEQRSSFKRELAWRSIYELAWTYFFIEREPSKVVELLATLSGGVNLRSQVFRDAILLLVDAYIRLGELDKAGGILSALQKALPRDDLLLFRLGELSILQGEIDKAQQLFLAISKRFPKSLYLNDALDYVFLLDNKEEVELVARARYAYRLGFKDEALGYLAKLSDSESGGGSTGAGCWALYQRGIIHKERGETKKALEFLNKLIDDYPGSFYLPLALEAVGDIYIELGNISDAWERYMQILSDYPNYVNIERLKKKLKAIEANL